MSISQNYPTISPSLSLDFANVKKLDSRITFARASSAVAYDGVTVAKAEENLALQSQNLITSWSQFRTARTLNATTAPDGTTTATLVAQAAGTTQPGVILQGMAVTATDYVISIFAKPNGRNFLGVEEGLLDGTNRTTWFNISTGAVGTTYVGHTATITASTNGFYRCSIKLTVNAARSGNFAFYISEFDNNKVTCADDGAGIYMWGAQLEQRDAVTAYTPTTTQPITNYIPTLLSAPANVARFDHSPTTGESLGLLVEEQRTNLLLRSEEFDNAAWTKTNVTVTANTIVAPDGTVTGDKLFETVGTGGHRIRSNNISLTQNVTYAYSIYAKKAERKYFAIAHINFVNWSGANPTATFDLDAGTVYSVGSGSTASIVDVGNGVYRCTLVATFTAASTTGQCDVYVLDDSGQFTYTGDGYSGIYIWGAQLEAGAFSTSYIKTEASQVTRSADSASMTGANFSSWFSQGEGTVYAEATMTYQPTGADYWLLSDGAITNSLAVLNGSVGVSAWSRVGGVTQAYFSAGSLTSSSPAKTAYSYKVNDFAMSLNGGTVATDINGIVPVVNQFSFGNSGVSVGGPQRQQWIKKLSYYSRRLSNAELQALTS